MTQNAILLAALTLTSLALSTPAQAQVVRLATEGAYPPWNFINEANQVDGFEREFGDAVCASAGLTCEWVVNDWDSLIPNLVGGNYDAIIASLSITEARQAVIAFTDEYLPPDPSAFFAPAGSGPDAAEGVVATQSNTIFVTWLAQTPATVAEFPGPEDVVAAVRAGVADAGLFDRAYLDPILSEPGSGLVYISDSLFLSNGVGIGLRQSDTELRAAFDAAIMAMKADGSLNAMIARWFGDDFPTFD
jgi:polar amino acid transport system substrate-binding protein